MKKYNVTGMSCAACSARVQKAVSSLDGVTECSVNLLTNSMTVEGDVSEKDIISAVEGAGYGVRLDDSSNASESLKEALRDRETPKILRRLIISAVFLLLLMYISMGHVMFDFPLPAFMQAPAILAVLQGILALIIMVVNRNFFINGTRGLLRRAPNMDTLVSLGSFASFAYSLVLTVIIIVSGEGHHLHGLYFESAAMILTLITLGKLLEAYSKGKTTNALRALMDLAPKKAILLIDGKEVEVSAEDVKSGDIFCVRSGESFPVDAVVIEGECAADESAITGESIPVDKVLGDNVSSGTVNKSGYVVCRATNVGSETTLSKIIQMVSEASATKAPIAKIADKVSGIFVPAVLVIALITTVVWYIIDQNIGHALARGISVLVISCPCALGLATPVAIMVGSGMGAKSGILFKNATSLEQAGGAEFVILDKTGTITKGRPEVTDVIPYDLDEQALLEYAYSLEKKSEHPLSHAINDYCESKGISLYESEGFKVLLGSGVEANINGKFVFAGNYKLVSGRIDMPKDMEDTINALSEQGKTPLMFCVDNTLAGVIAVADAIKEDSAEAISQLKHMGIKTIMLTGDNSRTAQAIGQLSGVDEIISDVLPEDKERVARKYKQYGRVIMVGDGINDAPALTVSDVGVAIGAGTDIAIDAADVVLMKSSLLDAVAGIRLSRKVLKNIKENLFWAFIYNIICIPLAAGVWAGIGIELEPMYGAAAMSLSSFCVVVNALRLNLFNVYNPKHDRKIHHKHKKENKEMTYTMNISGMMCPHCEARVKKTLEAIDGVISAEVSFKSDSAIVTTDGSVSADTLKDAVTAADYEVVSVI